jgi:hypothetical protein
MSNVVDILSDCRLFTAVPSKSFQRLVTPGCESQAHAFIFRSYRKRAECR